MQDLIHSQLIMKKYNSNTMNVHLDTIRSLKLHEQQNIIFNFKLIKNITYIDWFILRYNVHTKRLKKTLIK